MSAIRGLAIGLSLLALPGASLTETAEAAEIACLVRILSPDSKPDESAIDWLMRQGQPPSPSCSSILVKGPIEKGDYERFLALLKQTDPRGLVYLQSSGGLADEAMKIGRLLRLHLVTVRAPSSYRGSFKLKRINAHGKWEEICSGPTCTCASACALIWFGSVDREGTVGLHRPKLTELAAVTLEEARKIYNDTVQDVTAYLHEMEVPPTLIEKMLLTSSVDIHWVRDDDNVYSLRHPPSFAEWVNVRCGPPLTAAERKNFEDLDWKNIQFKKYSLQSQRLTPIESALYKSLEEQDSEHSLCRARLLDAERETQAPP